MPVPEGIKVEYEGDEDNQGFGRDDFGCGDYFLSHRDLPLKIALLGVPRT